jgi:hypothetical protein
MKPRDQLIVPSAQQWPKNWEPNRESPMENDAFRGAPNDIHYWRVMVEQMLDKAQNQIADDAQRDKMGVKTHGNKDRKNQVKTRKKVISP